MAYFKAGSLYFAQNSNVVVDNASGDIANFETPLCLPLLETKLGFSAKQDLHGYDSPWMDSTVLDKKPYLLQPISGTASRYGNYLYDKIIGGTVAFNQICVDSDFPDDNTTWNAANSNVSYSNNKATMRATAQNGYLAHYMNNTIGHCYLFMATIDTTVTNKISLRVLRTVSPYDSKNVSNTLGSKQTVSMIHKTSYDTERYEVRIVDSRSSDWDNVIVSDVNVIDLTQMFGSTIADYIYSLEQSTAGAGVAFFRNLFPKDYYAYNAGELMSVKTSKHITTGFNQWDEEWEVGDLDDTTGAPVSGSTRIRSKNFCSIIGGASYYAKDGGVGNLKFCYYDVDKNFISTTGWFIPNRTITIPSNARYFKLTTAVQYGTTYNHDICINLSWDGERNGEYEPYVKYEYKLDNELELRGIPKLDANNNLYYDGDIYESSGKVTRKYGIVDLGMLNWTYESVSNDFYSTSLSDIKKPTEWYQSLNMVCSKYETQPANSNVEEKHITQNKNSVKIRIQDSTYGTDATAFKTAMSGVYLVYELAEPTIETADAFTNPQVSDQYGTEEYLDSRTIPIPVGHETYQANICPIEGVSEVNLSKSGVNIFNEIFEQGSYSQTGKKITDPYRIRNVSHVNVKPNTQYYMVTPSYVVICCYDINKNFISVINLNNEASFTTPAGCYFINLAVGYSGYPLTPETYGHDISVNYPSSDHVYHPYTGSTALIQLGDTYYGGEVIIDKDGKRKIKATTEYADLGSFTWNNTADGYTQTAVIPNMKKTKSGSTMPNMLCDKLKVDTPSNVYSRMVDGSISIAITTANSGLRVYWSELDGYSAAQVKEALSGIHIVYKLITPLLIDLPDGAVIKSIPAVNNIFCNTGETAVKFRKIGE